MGSLSVSQTSRIAELSSLVATKTAKVDTYLRKNGLPTPSFEPDTPPVYKFPAEAADIETARLTAAEAALELYELLLGPAALMNQTVLNPPACGDVQAPFFYLIIFLRVVLILVLMTANSNIGRCD